MPTKTKTTTPAAIAADPFGGGVDLGAIKAPAKTGTKTAYPILPDPDGQVASLVGLVKSKAEEYDQVKGDLDLAKAELTAIAVPFYFSHYSGSLAEPQSSIAAHNGGDEVLVTFTSRFKETTDAAGVAAALGAHAGRFVRRAFVIKIDGDLIPPAAAPALIPALVALFAQHGASAALSKKEVLKPTSEFITARHTAFTPADNQAINLVLPIVTQVKTKGRK
jgi:hypothetical protein